MVVVVLVVVVVDCNSPGGSLNDSVRTSSRPHLSEGVNGSGWFRIETWQGGSGMCEGVQIWVWSWCSMAVLLMLRDGKDMRCMQCYRAPWLGTLETGC